MINANELRIGNWLRRQTQPDGFQVDAQSFHIIEIHPAWYEPIPLTPKILIACGFVDLHTEHCDSFRFKPLLIEMLPDTDIMIRIELGVKSYAYVLNEDRFYSLHQLQNLFFALTGEELIFNQ